MADQSIKTLFASDIHRRIEEVIKVDQTDEEILRDEIDEYVVTNAIKRQFVSIYERYLETPNKPHEGIAVWVSGFFGSGKSSFAKMLGLSISNRSVEGEPASDRLAQRSGDAKLQVLLKGINERIPTHAVIFDVSTDRGIRSGNQTLTEIMYGLFLQSLGYAKDLDLSELEITLEEKGDLKRFEEKYAELFKKDWNNEKGKIAFALGEASKVMSELRNDIYPSADSWVKGVKGKADISPGKLAERIGQLMNRRKPGHTLIFVVDEVGQFVARDIQKMLDLQAIVQNLGTKGRGKHWLVATSQEKLNDLVSGLDERKTELARLMDRFPQELQVHLETSDISEVTSRRVLSKNAAAQSAIGKKFDESRSRLTENTRVTADIKLPELSRQGLIDLYPLLPYQIELIIQVVSGLRTRGGGTKHVGGANRTIIKLAQQLLINPAVNLAERPLGQLASLDQVYDLLEGNIGSEIRAKINKIPQEVEHSFAQRVAKAICLLQYVQSVHRTAENIAAVLHPGIDADSQLPLVREALLALESAHLIRQGADGYRIPTPAEDDWERTRSGFSPKPGDAHRLCAETLVGFWQPQPGHSLYDTRNFKAGLAIAGREVVDGDVMFHLHLAEAGKEFQSLCSELRTRSQQEKNSIFWVAALSDATDREIVEVFRSKEILSRKEREARTGDEKTSLITEEKARLRRHQDELRRLLKNACLSGNAYFRGNERSPGETAVDVGRSAAEILGQVLPQVFERFKEGAARSADVKKGVEALSTVENLQGLPSVFGSLSLLRDEKGKVVFNTQSSPLADVLRRIEERAGYGDTASGRYLSDEFAKEPFGWDFDVVRLLVLSLLRAGKIDAISKGQIIESATSITAKETFSNNNLFRQASFRPKKGVEFEEILKASEAFRDTFGKEVHELNAGSVGAEVKQEVSRHEDLVEAAGAKLSAAGLPGTALLEEAAGQIKAIARGSEENALSIFNASHRSIKEAIKRAAELEQALTEPHLHDLARARQALSTAWPFLQKEPDLSGTIRDAATALADVLARETFFREIPAIDQHTRVIESEYNRRYEEALKTRTDAYAEAYRRLQALPSWNDLDPEQQITISGSIKRCLSYNDETLPIPQLRSELDACESRLNAAVAEMHRLLEGERVVTVRIGAYFADGIETEEQLDAALAGLREECARLIGAGKKIISQ